MSYNHKDREALVDLVLTIYLDARKKTFLQMKKPAWRS